MIKSEDMVIAIGQRFVEECEACYGHEAYLEREHDRVRDILADNYLDRDGTSELDDEVFWGKLSPQAGYLYIGSIGEFTDGDTIASDLALLEPVLDRVFDELGNLPGLVIDLRFNAGAMTRSRWRSRISGDWHSKIYLYASRAGGTPTHLYRAIPILWLSWQCRRSDRPLYGERC